MANWPEDSDLVEHLTQHPGGLDGANVTRNVKAANAHLVTRTIFDANPALGDPTEIPDDMFTAAVLLAAKLYGRPATPNGVGGGGDEVGAYYVTRTDPDVKTLIAPYLRIPLVIV